MRKLIAGNWKMNGAQAWSVKPAGFDRMYASEDRTHIDVLICPPFPFIREIFTAAGGRNILVGGQNCHTNEKGAHTGEVSAEMLADCGASFVIVGHSERRAAGENDENVLEKAKAAFRAGVIPIICVGETLEQKEAGNAADVVGSQINGSVPADAEDYVVAYEPVWAIGTGKVASIDDIKTMHAHIRKICGAKVRILYGGSVKPGNAAEILATPNVDGALIGGASLDMADFVAIARTAG